MPAPNILRAKQREEIKPLIDELNRIFAGRKHTVIADESGITNYQVGRILGDFLPAPTYLDITKLLRAANMSPNEAAAIVGLYDQGSENGETGVSAYERRVLHLLRHSRLTPTQRHLLMQVIEATVHGLEGHALLDGMAVKDVQEESPEVLTALPDVSATRRRSGRS